MNTRGTSLTKDMSHVGHILGRPIELAGGPESEYRITRQLPLIRLEAFCRALQAELDSRYSPDEIVMIWRLYLSAECDRCGIRVYGDELRALALAPLAELASAKTGRMRLGDCARIGCESAEYCVHFWPYEALEWGPLIQSAGQSISAAGSRSQSCLSRWLPNIKRSPKALVMRTVGAMGLIAGLVLARELYLGGRIPFFREPEKFQIETTTIEDEWPAPIEASEGPA